MMSYPQIREDVIAVAEALMGGKPVPSIGGGGGSSSDLRWDGRNPDEDEHDYRIRCMLTASGLCDRNIIEEFKAERDR